MTHVVSNSAPIIGAHTVKQYAGFGILGADIPTTGDNGGSPVLNDGILATSEYYWEIETPPGSGTVTIYPDMSFVHSDAADGSWPWVYRLHWVDADGTNGNATATVTDVFGVAAIALAIASASHGNAADNIGVSTNDSSSLSIVDSTHWNTANSLYLSTTGSANLSVADSIHDHMVDIVPIAIQWLLTIADAVHVNSADNIALDSSNVVWLTVQEIVHAHVAGNIGLGLQTWLAVDDTLQAHYASLIRLLLQGQFDFSVKVNGQCLPATVTVKHGGQYVAVPSVSLKM